MNFTFENALQPQGRKSEIAQEIAIMAKTELNSRIATVKGLILQENQLADLNTKKLERKAAKSFKAELGNLEDHDLERVLEAYKNYKNLNASEKTSSNIQKLESELALLEDVLKMYPEDPNTLVVEEEAK